MDRIILHSDMNCFYASVEMMLNPLLRGKAVAVCGATEDRHGIVLAKSEKAKKAGIKTGMVNYEARQLCPEVIFVHPQYDEYLKYSRLARDIYQRYTDQVEPYGMDECFLDCSSSKNICGNGMQIAESIRKTIKNELGLTVSIGVSYNKIFAKLGSDMKKPDAITEITRENYRSKVWRLPISDLLYAGRSTTRKLNLMGIYTIGDLAEADPELLKHWLGVNGRYLWTYANGLDTSRVMHKDFVSPIKSVGHGITCYADLENEEEVWKVILELAQDVGHKLRIHGLSARGVQLSVRNHDLVSRQMQAQVELPTQSPLVLAKKAKELFHEYYDWRSHVRAVTIRAINLIEKPQETQMSLFVDTDYLERLERLETAVEEIRRRFGKKAVFQASLMGDLKMPNHGNEDMVMPGMMYR